MIPTRRRFQKSASLVILAVALVVASAGRTEAGIIFSDNFTPGPSPLWGNEIGNWTTSGGAYFAQSPSNNPTTYTSLPYSLGDLTIVEDINKVQDGGIYLHAADSNNGVLLVTGGNNGTGTGLYWHIIQNGSFSSPLNEVTGLFTPGVSDIQLTVTVIGDVYSAYINGSTTPATTLTTSLFPTGKVGLYDFSGQTVSNFVLSTPSAVPEPSSMALLGIGSILLAGFARYRPRVAQG